jgi:hypothetical protein
VVTLPEVELLAAGLSAKELKPDKGRSAYLIWRLRVHLFVAPRNDTPIVIPMHRCETSIHPSEAADYALPLADFSFGSDMPDNVVTKNAATVKTPGLVTVEGHYAQYGYSLPLKSERVRVVGKARPIGADGSIDWSCELARQFPERKNYAGIWGIGPFASF